MSSKHRKNAVTLTNTLLTPKHNFLERQGWDGQSPKKQEGGKSWQPRELIWVKHSFRNDIDVQCSQNDQTEEFIPVGCWTRLMMFEGALYSETRRYYLAQM